MAIRMKRSAVPAKVPTTAQIELGELAVNTYDGKLYMKKKNGSDVIVEITRGVATQAEAEAGTDSVKVMSALWVKQAILTFSPPAVAIDYLMVAGGGGGGVVQGSDLIFSGQSKTVTIGAGGAGASNNVGGLGRNGGDTSVTGYLTAAGGGAGGVYTGRAAQTGGSGGGSSGYQGTPVASSPVGQGNRGGGGGYSAVGSNGSGNVLGGNGGAGLGSSISGSVEVYGSGGGGANGQTASATTSTGETNGGSGASASAPATSGADGYSGGGGGSRALEGKSGDGGNAVFIVRYLGTPC